MFGSSSGVDLTRAKSVSEAGALAVMLRIQRGVGLSYSSGVAAGRLRLFFDASNADNALFWATHLCADGCAMNPDMEPPQATNHELADVLNELKSRELIFHRPEWGTSRSDFEHMIAADFWEVGASGRKYSREYVLRELEKRCQNPVADAWETSDFHCRRLAEDVYLLTYSGLQGTRKTLRSTIWQRTSAGWKIVYHQGTIIQDSVAEP